MPGRLPLYISKQGHLRLLSKQFAEEEIATKILLWKYWKTPLQTFLVHLVAAGYPLRLQSQHHLPRRRTTRLEQLEETLQLGKYKMHGYYLYKTWRKKHNLTSSEKISKLEHQTNQKRKKEKKEESILFKFTDKLHGK